MWDMCSCVFRIALLHVCVTRDNGRLLFVTLHKLFNLQSVLLDEEDSYVYLYLVESYEGNCLRVQSECVKEAKMQTQSF